VNKAAHMSSDESDTVAGFEAKHAAIIARTLGWADDAASRGDYAQAVHWIETVRGLGHDVPDEYEAKLQMWLNATGRDRRARG